MKYKHPELYAYVAISLSSTAQMIAATTLEKVIIVDVEKQELMETIDLGDDISVHGLDFASDQLLLVRGRRRFDIWDWRQRKRIRRISGYASDLSDADLSKNGKIATSTKDGLIVVWDLAKKTPLFRAQGDEKYISVALSPTEKWLAVGSAHGQLSVISLIDDSVRWAHRLHKGLAMDVVFSHDGTMIATLFDDGTIVVADRESGKAIGRVVEEDLISTSRPQCRFSADDGNLTTMTQDRSLHRWPLADVFEQTKQSTDKGRTK